MTDEQGDRQPAVRILVLQHDDADGPQLLGQWLADAGAEVEVRRLQHGDPQPSSAAELSAGGFDAVVSMGGSMGAQDDDVAPWLPMTRDLLASTTAAGTPTLGICLGAQLLAIATGGSVRTGEHGPEVGAYLTAKRDAADKDPLFASIPMTPDVMHCHADVIDGLPPGGVLLLTGSGHPGYPHQAFRVGRQSWGIQFHIEATAETVREWARSDGLSGRLGPELDEAAENMAVVWRHFAQRFVELIRDPPRPTLSLLS